MNNHVNLLGLDEFGQNPGMNPLWGVLLGGGVSYGTSAIIRGASDDVKWLNWSDFVGFLAGLATGGALLPFGSTRQAGWGALAGAIFGAGFRAAENALTKSKGVGGMGVPVVNQLGLPQVNYLSGLGIPTVSNVLPSHGTVPGVAGLAGTAGVAQAGHLGPPVSLLGPGSPLAMQAQMIAGPTLQAPHGLASAYGASLFG